MAKKPPPRLEMYTLYAGLAALLVIAFLLIQYRPVEGFAYGAKRGGVEHFTTVAVDPRLSPACAARSADAQKLLARFATTPEEDADASELRLLISKLCCMEADIATPAAGLIRTLPLQFRTSSDMDVASSIVGRCRAGAIQQRDIDLILDKFSVRGHALVARLCPQEAGAAAELDSVLGRLRWAMTSFCLKPTPTMDKPIGARDMGFWEPESVADLSQYQGISAEPK
jgi:hypothetical protein